MQVTTKLQESVSLFSCRIPQALVWFGALEYSEDLKNILNKRSELKNGDRQEVEIRGCTIEAVRVSVI